MKANSFPSLLTNNVSGYVIALSAETDHSRTMDQIYAETNRAVARFDVTTPKGQALTVELYHKRDSAFPHGYSVNGRDDYSGLLSFDGMNLEDFDGLSFLPKAVCATLRALGFTVADDFVSSPL